jgi:hypothetical protein
LIALGRVINEQVLGNAIDDCEVNESDGRMKRAT